MAASSCPPPLPVSAPSVVLDGDSGTPQIVNAGDTLLIIGAPGSGISTVVSAPDTLEIDFDICQAIDSFVTGAPITDGTISVLGADCQTHTITFPSAPPPISLTDGVTTEVVSPGDTITVATSTPAMSVVVSGPDTIEINYDLCTAISGLPGGTTDGTTGLLGSDCLTHPAVINITDGTNTEVVALGQTITFTSLTPGLVTVVGPTDQVSLSVDVCEILSAVPAGVISQVYGVDAGGNCVLGPLPPPPDPYTFSITDGTTTQVVDDGDTVSFVSANPNLTAVVSATDTVTFDYDLCGDLSLLPDSPAAIIDGTIRVLAEDCEFHSISFPLPPTPISITDGTNTETLDPGDSLLVVTVNPNLTAVVSPGDTLTLDYDLCGDLNDLPTVNACDVPIASTVEVMASVNGSCTKIEMPACGLFPRFQLLP